MKKLKDFCIEKFDWILILAGSCVLSFNLLSYSIHCYGFPVVRGIPFRLLLLPDYRGKVIHAFAYYYDPQTRFFITLGVALLVSGILIMRNKSKK